MEQIVKTYGTVEVYGTIETYGTTEIYGTTELFEPGVPLHPKKIEKAPSIRVTKIPKLTVDPESELELTLAKAGLVLEEDFIFCEWSFLSASNIVDVK